MIDHTKYTASFSITRELHQLAKRLARVEHTNASEIVRRALKDYAKKLGVKGEPTEVSK